MSKYRISFLCDIDKTLVKRTWASFLMLAAQHRMLPKTVFKTGNSKKEALKHAVDLTNPESVSAILDKILRDGGKTLNDRIWPDFIGYSLWAENPTGGDDYRIEFDSALRGSQNVFFMMLRIPDSQDINFDEFLEDLRRNVECDVIVSKFDGYTTNILAINEKDGIWVDRLAAPKEYARIQRWTGFKPK